VSRLRAFGRFWFEFVIGDDWRLAAGALVALVLAGIVAHAGGSAWWIVPLAVSLLLGVSVLRASPRS
jgi:hypothetical protein